MKQLVIALVIALALSGCGLATPTAQSEGSSTAPQPTQAFYQPATPVERGTAGAVRAYDMGETITGIAPFGENLLVCTDGKKLSILDGTSLAILQQRELDVEISWNSSSFMISGTQIGYFSPSDNSYVILNGDLVTESTTKIPSQPKSDPVITTDFQTIYYATKDGIFAMDLRTGISRPLRQEHAEILSLNGLLFDDQILSYTRMGSNGAKQTSFIDSHDGRSCYTATYDAPVVHWGNKYATAPRIEHPFGVFQRILTGTREGDVQMLCPKQNWDALIWLGGPLMIAQSQSTVGITLNSYHLETGNLIAQVTLPGFYDVLTDGCVNGNQVWLWSSSGSTFYCWDMDKTPPRDPISVLAEFTSVTDSQETALSALIQRGQTLADQYGISIHFTENGNRTQGLDYTTVPDYRQELYENALNLLEETLHKLPKDFLPRVGERSNSGTMQIHLVDDFDPSVGIHPGKGSCEFMDGGVRINVSMCADLERLFFRELGNAIITRITSVGNGLENWSDFNPAEFQYGTGADESSPYLAPKENYFTDATAMKSPRDDQAQVFRYAMLPDQQAVFTSRPMQEKLSSLCNLIRSTYDISSETQLPWEQYLQAE